MRSPWENGRRPRILHGQKRATRKAKATYADSEDR
jgi:hypothetical protein